MWAVSRNEVKHPSWPPTVIENPISASLQKAEKYFPSELFEQGIELPPQLHSWSTPNNGQCFTMATNTIQYIRFV